MFDPGRAFAIPSERVQSARPWLMPFLEEFEREAQTMSAEDVFRQAASADAQLWSYYDGEKYRGVIATRIHPMARGSLCSIWVCYGLNAEELFDGMYQIIEDWAQSMGCYGIEIVGRPGWQRVLPGFKRRAVILEKVFA
jgi:hypothetical protein